MEFVRAINLHLLLVLISKALALTRLALFLVFRFSRVPKD